MQSDNLLTQAIDALVQEAYQPSEPGVAVIVIKNGQTILNKFQAFAH